MIEPVYPLTEGLSANMLHKTIDAALAKVPVLPEWQDPAFQTRNGFPTFAQSLFGIHRPSQMTDVDPASAVAHPPRL